MKKIIFATVFLAIACGCSTIHAPEGYMKIEEPGQRYKFKAVSPDGCAFTVTEEANEGVSELDSWKKAVENQLVRGRGYEKLSEGEFTTVKGSTGWEMVFATEKNGLEYTYFVAVLRRDKAFWGIHNLCIVEAAGEKAFMEKDFPAIRSAARKLPY